MVSLWEVTVSADPQAIKDRAAKVAAWAAATEESGVKAVLALDRAAYFKLSEADREHVRDLVVNAGGYISLFRDLTKTAAANARAAADAIERANVPQ